jgi:hypothetical protein
MPESVVYNEDCVEGIKSYPDKYFAGFEIDISMLKKGGSKSSKVN